jgi:hypothetical protein
MDNDWPEPKVTDNAVLLAGYLCAAFTSDPMYQFESADPDHGVTVLKTRTTGNRFRVTVEQISGTE